MAAENEYIVTDNSEIAGGIYKMSLSGDTSAVGAPGTFINIRTDGKFLRRPISVCDYGDDRIDIIYRVVGEGTRIMSEIEIGKKINALCGLGNGFDLAKCAGRTLIVGGGVGTPPMYGLASRLAANGSGIADALGFSSASDSFYMENFRALGAEVAVSSVDGSLGTKGFVTDAIETLGGKFDSFCACGPMPMLRALCEKLKIPGQLSLEERMGCGFGACMGCSVKTKNGYKRVCKDGPVFDREEIIW